MSTAMETRIEVLEERSRWIEDRLERVELRSTRTSAASGQAAQAAQAAQAPVPVAEPARSVAAPPVPTAASTPVQAPARASTPAQASSEATSSPAPDRPAVALEDLLGGRVLAWVGGVAVVVGIVLLLVIAASNGWIGEAARTVIAALTSLGLLLTGIHLQERRRRTDAALAASAAGVCGLFPSIVVAAQVYALVPSSVGLVLAMAVGATATLLAVRWEAPGMGALGIVGALLAPALVGAEVGDAGVLALVGVATASATAVLLRQRWTWLAFATFLIATPQWLEWLLESGPHRLPASLLVLCGFGVLGAIAAAGFEVRSREPGLRLSAANLLALNALVLAGAGWFAFAEPVTGPDHPAVAHAWLIALAAAHLGAGLAGRRGGRVSHELSLVALGIGVALADIVFGTLASGPVLAIAWAAIGAAFATRARRSARRPGDEAFTVLGTGLHLSLALGHAFAYDAPVRLVGEVGTARPAGVLALMAVVAGCFVSGRLAQSGRREWRVLLDAIWIAVLAYTAAVAFDGVALVLAWAVLAVGLAALGRQAEDDVAGWGALTVLGGAVALALARYAPPVALLDGVRAALPAALALGACTAAALLAAGRRTERAPVDRPHVRTALLTTAALAALHLASVELVTAVRPGAGPQILPLAELGWRQQSQALLSGLWALCGVVTLIAGLVRDVRGLRLGALGLLGVTAAKVFAFDLASLTSVYRVASFIALGLLLLCGAFAWQRFRPRAPEVPDLPAA